MLPFHWSRNLSPLNVSVVLARTGLCTGSRVAGCVLIVIVLCVCVEVNIGDIYSIKIILVVHPFPLCFYLGSSFFGGANWVCFVLFVHGLTVVFAWSVFCCYVSFFLCCFVFFVVCIPTV